MDIRTKPEWLNGVIKGSVLCAKADIIKSHQCLEGKLDKKKPVYVYCLMGERVNEVTPYLKAYGYRDVVKICGSMTALKKDLDSQIVFPEI